MRKLNIILLLSLYACIQLAAIAWDYYKPVLHFVCYRLLRKDQEEGKSIIIKTDYSTYKNSVEDDHEISWQGLLYDIKDISVTGNTVTLFVEKDDTENKWMELYDSISQHIATGKSHRSPIYITRYQWLFKLYMPSNTKEPANSIGDIVPNNCYHIGYFPSFFPENPCQPPDCC
jgi:hypothetical protein